MRLHSQAALANALLPQCHLQGGQAGDGIGSPHPHQHHDPRAAFEDHAETPFSIDTINRIYDWAESRADPIICFARDLVQIQPISGTAAALGGTPIYVHKNMPCLNATICGLVVAVTPKENKILYEVDDGTALIRVVQGTSRQTQVNNASRTRAPQEPSGIPACYIRPPSPPAKKSQPSSHIRSLERPKPCVDVGALVRVTGRIETEWDGVRSLHTHAIASLLDPNEESLHQLQAINLAQAEYSLPLSTPRLEQLLGPARVAFSQACEATAPFPQGRSSALLAGSNRARSYRYEAAHEDEEKRALLRRLVSSPEVESESPNAAESLQDEKRFSPYPSRRRSSDASSVPPLVRENRGRLSSSMARRLLMSQSDSPELDAPDHTRVGNDRCCSSRNARTSGSEPRSLLSSTAFSRKPKESDAAEASVRRLRHPRKLKDDRISDSYFRLHLQMRVGQRFHSKRVTTRRPEEASPLAPQSSPTFTVSDLTSDPDLWSLATRVVTLRMSQLAASRIRASSESVQDKTLRLFQWAVRQMLSDGYIILAPQSPDVRMVRGATDADTRGLQLPPSSGEVLGASAKPRDSRSRARSSFAREVIEVSDSSSDETRLSLHSKNHRQGTSSSKPGSISRSRTTQTTDEERYQLLSTELLVEPVLAMLRRHQSKHSRQHLHTDDILERIKARDQRFNAITREVVEQTLYSLLRAELLARGLSGDWQLC